MGHRRLEKTTKINRHTLLVFVLTTYLVVQGATYLTFDSETDNLAAMREDAVFHRYCVENDGYHLFGSLTARSESHCGAHSLRINDGIQAFSFVEDGGSSLGGDNCLLYKCVDVNKSSQLLQAGSTRMFVRQTTVFPNLALGKHASMSSFHRAPFYASAGNDNNETTFFHTNQWREYGAWWRVDLNESACVQAVRLVNEASTVAFWERHEDLSITVAATVGDIFYDPANTDNLCNFHEGQLLVLSELFHCRSIIYGRFVQVQNSLTRFSIMHLAEIEVYGSMIN